MRIQLEPGSRLSPPSASLRALEEAISRRFGLRLDASATANVAGGLDRIAARLRLDRQRAVERVLTDPDLIRELAGQLTVEESYFFRGAQQMEWAAAKLATWMAPPAGTEAVLWSAGCATGEEAYSLAIVLTERQLGVAARASIMACDIKAEAIARARAGVYGEWSFRGVSAEVRQRHFERIDGRYAILPAYRQRVRFHHLGIEELAATLAARSVGIVFFRNVGVYLEPTALARIHAAFARVLAPDGALVQAATDPAPRRGLFVRHEHDPVGVFHQASGCAAQRSSVSGPRQAALPAPTRIDAGLNAAPSGVRLRPSSAPGAPSSHHGALALANRGMLDQALLIANRAVERVPGDPEPVLFRAQLELARGNVARSIEDLRRALFLAPENRLGRYWYILALEAAGDTSRALGQLRELRRQVVALPAETLLEDGETGAGELRQVLDAHERALL